MTGKVGSAVSTGVEQLPARAIEQVLVDDGSVYGGFAKKSARPLCALRRAARLTRTKDGAEHCIPRGSLSIQILHEATHKALPFQFYARSFDTANAVRGTFDVVAAWLSALNHKAVSPVHSD